MTVALKCDGPECDTWSVTGRLTEDWLIVVTPAEGMGGGKHFCNGWCLAKWAASWSNPPTVIEFGA
jgi:hypothetical protein